MAMDTTRRLRQETKRQRQRTAPSDGRVVPHRLSDMDQSQRTHVPVPFVPAPVAAHGGGASRVVVSQLSNAEPPTAAFFSNWRPGTSVYQPAANGAGWSQPGKAPPQGVPMLVLALVTLPDSQLGKLSHRHGLSLHQPRQQPHVR
jgi:hypothetical protein